MRAQLPHELRLPKDPTTHCTGGYCVGNICAGDAGPYFTTCNAGDAGDGYCQPLVNNNNAQVGACTQTGGLDAGQVCSSAASRPDGGDFCVGGTTCYTTSDAGAVCTFACDPTATTGPCGTGNVCSPNINASSFNAGVCYPAGANGCAVGLTNNGSSTELGSCANNAACGCNLAQSCITDPGQGATVCEIPCTTTADCDLPTTVCTSGHCVQDYCDVNPLGAAAQGTYDGPCNVADAGDGTCQAQYPAINFGFGFFPLVSAPYGVCQLNGSVTVASGATCDGTISTKDAGALCQPEAECFNVTDSQGNPTTACIGLCDALAYDGGCGSGNGCFEFYPDFEGFTDVAPTYGICQPCSTSTMTCIAGAECCSGTCTAGACM